MGKCEIDSTLIEVDEQRLRSHVAEVVRQSVEETLNGLLDAEADARSWRWDVPLIFLGAA